MKEKTVLVTKSFIKSALRNLNRPVYEKLPLYQITLRPLQMRKLLRLSLLGLEVHSKTKRIKV